MSKTVLFEDLEKKLLHLKNYWFIPLDIYEELQKDRANIFAPIRDSEGCMLYIKSPYDRYDKNKKILL